MSSTSRNFQIIYRDTVEAPRKHALDEIELSDFELALVMGLGLVLSIRSL